ncbi:MAG TPA: transcription antitermination factor NusB [Syntrophomonadaceae bacterium]|nr:transcription antitermination factor NusB [Syntrophomonadaceae bacterium]
MSRRKAREVAFKVLFQVDQVEADPHRAFRYMIQDVQLEEKDRDFSWQLVEGSLNHLREIDEKISHFAKDWALERMSAVDKNIMRIASFEILFTEDSQSVVAIDEAIEISKRYGEENSGSFVNAILDKILGEKNEHLSGD